MEFLKSIVQAAGTRSYLNVDQFIMMIYLNEEIIILTITAADVGMIYVATDGNDDNPGTEVIPIGLLVRPSRWLQLVIPL